MTADASIGCIGVRPIYRVWRCEQCHKCIIEELEMLEEPWGTHKMNNKKLNWLVDVCRQCGKIRQQGDIYFCGGCGQGSMETSEESKWEEIYLERCKSNNSEVTNE